MNNRIQFYRLWRQISIAMMAAIVAIVLTTIFMSSTSYATNNSSPIKICSYKEIHFCLVLPADGSIPFTSMYHGAEPAEGIT